MLILTAERIKSLRESRDLTQSALAKKLSVTRAIVNAWEMGVSVPTVDKIIDLTYYFDASIISVVVLLQTIYYYIVFIFLESAYVYYTLKFSISSANRRYISHFLLYTEIGVLGFLCLFAGKGTFMHKTQLSNELANATGSIEFSFTNDYMFRAILQRNHKVLKALICSMLHIDPHNVISLEITNPIILGQHIDSKEFILDITVMLNDNTHIDLEMQIENEQNWQERSLSYLCRSFDHLVKGDNYNIASAAIHIGFLNFTPFPDSPEFYARYRLLNVKNHRMFTSKFMLNMLDLTHVELATEEDKAYEIDYWAKLFKAKTWEDLKMIAEKNTVMAQASEDLYALNCDKTIRDMCLAREDAIRHEKLMNRIIAEKDAEIKRLKSLLEDKNN